MPNPLHILNKLPRAKVLTLVPRVTLMSSPAYQLPEVMSDADLFALNLITDTPHMTELERIALAWLAGRMNGKGGDR